MFGAVAVLLTVLLATAAWAADPAAQAAVEAFVARLSGIAVTDLVIDQALTIYHPDGRHPQSRGEQRVYLKLPRRQRIEQTIEGQREVRLAVGDRAWLRTADGRVEDVSSRGDARRDRTDLLVPHRRRAADVLAEWRALGIRDDVAWTADMGTRAVTVIGAPPGDRESPSVWIDGEYGVVRFVTRQRLTGRPSLVDLTFAEHRRLVGAFFFPHRQEVFLNGRMVLLVVVRSVVVDTALPDALFDPDTLKRGG